MFVKTDPLGNPVDRRHPWNQTTTPQPQKRDFNGKYTWVMSPRWFDKRTGDHLALDTGGGPIARLWSTALAGLVDIGYVKATGHSVKIYLPKTAMLPEVEFEWKIPKWSNAIERDRARTYFQAYAAAAALYFVEKAMKELHAGRTKTWTEFKVPDDAIGCGFHEAVRGVLSHHVVIRDGKIANYHPYPPTPWNASPRDIYGTPGPYEDAVQNTPIFEENGPDKFKGIDIMRAVRSFDPCLPCGVHMYLGRRQAARREPRADVRGAEVITSPERQRAGSVKLLAGAQGWSDDGDANDDDARRQGVPGGGAAARRLCCGRGRGSPTPPCRRTPAPWCRRSSLCTGPGWSESSLIWRRRATPAGPSSNACADDEVVAGLLLLHGLHPHDLEAGCGRRWSARAVALRSHGGEVELIGVSDGVVRLRLSRADDGRGVVGRGDAPGRRGMRFTAWPPRSRPWRSRAGRGRWRKTDEFWCRCPCCERGEEGACNMADDSVETGHFLAHAGNAQGRGARETARPGAGPSEREAGPNGAGCDERQSRRPRADRPADAAHAAGVRASGRREPADAVVHQPAHAGRSPGEVGPFTEHRSP